MGAHEGPRGPLRQLREPHASLGERPAPALVAVLATSAMVLAIGVATATIAGTGGRPATTPGMSGMPGSSSPAAPSVPICDFRTEGQVISPADPPKANQAVCTGLAFSAVSVAGPETSKGKFSSSFRFFRRPGGSLFLYAAGRAGTSGMGVNLGASIPAGQVARFIDSFAAPSLYFGTAVQSVAAVTAVLPDGRRYAGSVIDGPGFPYKVWQVYCPMQSSVPTLIFRDKAGHVLGQLSNHPNPQASGPPLSINAR